MNNLEKAGHIKAIVRGMEEAELAASIKGKSKAELEAMIAQLEATQ